MLKYPAIIDDTVLPTVHDGATHIKASALNDLRDAIIRIEKELGVKPSRIYTNVKTRLDEIDKIITRMSGGDLVRVLGTPKKGQTIIWNGKNWVPDTNFLSENLTTTANFKVGRAKSTSAHSGLINISGKFVLNKIPTPAVSDPGDGIIFFDGYQFMVSENGSGYIPLNVGGGIAITPAFVANGDLSGTDLSQTVIGLRNKPVSITSPKSGEALIFDSSLTGKWITGTDFGSNAIYTSGDFKTKNITISDFGTNPGILKSKNRGQIFSQKIFDADVDGAAAIKGTKIIPEFGYQDILTQKSISAKTAYSPKIYLGSMSNPAIISTQGPLPTSGNDGDIHFGTDGYVRMWKSGAWSLLKINPSGPASGDLSGAYPNPSVVGIKGVPVSSAPSPLPDGYVLSSTGSSFNFSSVDLTKPNAVSGFLPKENQQPQPLSGDLSGATDSATVVGIQNVTISPIEPKDGYFLSYDGSKFAPTSQADLAASLPLSGPAAGDLSGNYPGPIVSKIQGLSLDDFSSLNSGNIFQVIGTDPAAPAYLGFAPVDLSDENIENTLPDSKQSKQLMSGDVNGPTNSATVAYVNSMLLDAVSLGSMTADKDGYCLVYDAPSGAAPSWKAKPISTGGTPNTPLTGNGDLGGSYPGPSVIRINGASVPQMPSTAMDGYFLKVKNSTTSPPVLEYGPLDLTGPLFIDSIPSTLQDSQTLGGDLSGTTASASVLKIQNVTVDDPKVPQSIGKPLAYVSDSLGGKFKFSQPNIQDLDGYVNINGQSSPPSSQANYGEIYYDSVSSKLKAIENAGAAQDIIKPTTTRNLIVSELSAAGLLPNITGHTTTTLPDGYVLIVGGFDGTNYLSTAYLYDPNTNTLQLLDSQLAEKRAYHTATLTQRNDGTYVVAIIGGQKDPANNPNLDAYYVVNERKFYSTTYGVKVRYHTATRLKNNNILVCGGDDFTNPSGNSYLYSVNDNTFIPYSANLSQIKYQQTRSNPLTPIVPPLTAEIEKRQYPTLNIPRKNHTATLIDNPGDPLDGYVLIAGGVDASKKSISYAELYDPTTNYFYSYAQPQKYDGCATATLGDGRILFTGGSDGSGYVKDCYIYDPKTNLIEKACPLNDARYRHTITLSKRTDDYDVFIIVGGYTNSTFAGAKNSSGYATLVEEYSVSRLEKKTTSQVMWSLDTRITSPLQLVTPRVGHTTTKFDDSGLFLICGGYTGSNPDFADKAEVLSGGLYIKQLSSPMLYPRANHTATLLNDTVMICGGEAGCDAISNPFAVDKSTLIDSSGNWITTNISNVDPRVGRPGTAPQITYAGATTSYLYRFARCPTSAVEHFDFNGYINSSDISKPYFVSYTMPLPIGAEAISGLTTSTDLKIGNFQTAASNFYRLTNYSSIALSDGTTLICGGLLSDGVLVRQSYTSTPIASNYSFIFDPKTNFFYRTGSMYSGVFGHTLTEVSGSGSVICIGGAKPGEAASYATGTVQRYNILTRSWSLDSVLTDQLSRLSARLAFHTATKVDSCSYRDSSGRISTSPAIIIAGGISYADINSTIAYTSSSVYQIIIDNSTVRQLASLNQSRIYHTATYLGADPSGATKILFAGGNFLSIDNCAYKPDALSSDHTYYWYTAGGASPSNFKYPSTVDAAKGSAAEVYEISGLNPNGNSTPVRMKELRARHSANMMSNGKVLIAGGADERGPLISNTVEIFDLAGLSFSYAAINLNSQRYGHVALNLDNDKILMLSSNGTGETYDYRNGSSLGLNISPAISYANPNLGFWNCAFKAKDYASSGAVYFIPHNPYASYSSGSLNIPSIKYTVNDGNVIVFGKLNSLSTRRSHHDICKLTGANKLLFMGGFSNTNYYGGGQLAPIGAVTSPTTNPFNIDINVYVIDTFVQSNYRNDVFDFSTNQFIDAGPITNASTTTKFEGVFGFGSSEILNTGTALDNSIFLAGGQKISTSLSGPTQIGYFDSTTAWVLINGIKYSYSRTIKGTKSATSYSMNSSCYSYNDTSITARSGPSQIVNPPSSLLTSTKKTKTDVCLSGQNIYIMGGYNTELPTAITNKLYPTWPIGDYSTAVDSNHYVPTIHKYNCASGTWSFPGVMNMPRSSHAASSLSSGNVLVTGGVNLPATPSLNTAEIFDKSNYTFSSTNPMSSSRVNHTAVRLSSGEILVSGGASQAPTGVPVSTQKSELYGGGGWTSPAATGNTFINWKFDDPVAIISPSGSITSITASALNNYGTSGAVANLSSSSTFSSSLFSADSVYGTAAVTSATGPKQLEVNPGKLLSVPLLGGVTVDLENGKILILDGVTKAAHIFDGYTGTCRKLSAIMTEARSNAYSKTAKGNQNVYQTKTFTATLLADKNTVLITGGLIGVFPAMATSATAEIFDISKETFTKIADMPISRTNHTATLLIDGTVLICGGYYVKSGGLNIYNNLMASPSIIFNLNTKQFSTLPAGQTDMITPRWGHTATKIPDGRVIIIGGAVWSTDRNGVNTLPTPYPTTIEQYVPNIGFKSSSSGVGSIIYHSSLLVKNSIYVIGGTSDLTTLAGTKNKIYMCALPATQTSALTVSGSIALPTNTSVYSAVYGNGQNCSAATNGSSVIIVNGNQGEAKTSSGSIDARYNSSSITIVSGLDPITGACALSSSTVKTTTANTYNLCWSPLVHVINAPGSAYDGYALIIDNSSMGVGSSMPELLNISTRENLSFNQPSNKKITVSAWVKIKTMPSTGSIGTIIYKNLSADPSNNLNDLTSCYMPLVPGGICLSVDEYGKIQLDTTISRNQRTIKSNASISANAWHHIVATYDNSVSELKLYIDGSLDSSMTSSSSPSTPTNGLLDWGLGLFNIGSIDTWNVGTRSFINPLEALIDEIRIENYAATPQQINDLYKNGIANVWVPTGDLITARWGHTASVIPQPSPSPDKVIILGGYKDATIISNIEKYDHSTKQYSQVNPRGIVVKNYTALSTDSNIVFLDKIPTSPKSITCNVTLDSSLYQNGKLITVSISPYFPSSDYTINILSTSDTDSIPINIFNKSSVTLILDTTTDTSKPTWIPIDNAS